MIGEVLKLNSCYMPIGIIDWRDAINLWVCDKAEIIETYDDKFLKTGNSFKKPEFQIKDQHFIQNVYDEKLDSWHSVIKMPAVIRLMEFISPKKKLKFFESFTRSNVYERDKGICQYCGKEVSKNKFTFDHVIPKSREGKTNWKNIVCCCLKCNSKKDNRTPQEAGMKLIQKPVAPIIADNYNLSMIKKIKAYSNAFNNQKWIDYLYWNIEIKE